MSDTIADIQNASLWESVYSVSKAAEFVSSVTYRPIPEVVVPFPITSRLVIAFAETRNAPPSWHSAGFLSRYLATGITVGGDYQTKLGFSRRLMLGKYHLIDWDTYGQTPRYSFLPHKWLMQLTFRIWQFTGDVSSIEEEKIDLTRIDLLRLEATLKLLADRDMPTTYTVDIE